jgi:phosphoenolpyruvate carboxykinase (GTP)
MTSKLKALQSWVDQIAGQTQPDSIRWCTGSDAEYQEMIEKMLTDGTLSELNKDQYPNCYLHLSNPNDVARVEHLTFVWRTRKTPAPIIIG